MHACYCNLYSSFLHLIDCCHLLFRDSSGKTAYNIAVTKDSRNAFRRFRGKHPDRYDYEAAQVSNGYLDIKARSGMQ